MSTSHEIVALVPMKANSSRVRGKNFRLFAGKPLFRWILDTLIEMEEIDRIIINTDARGILAHHGLVDSERVLIRDRKPELCGDTVSMNKVLADDIAAIDSKLYLMTHTTNPLLSAETMRRALTNLRASGAHDSLFSVNRHQTRFYKEDATPVNHDPANLIPTQDLEPWYEENSNLYLFSRESFARTNARIGTSPLLYPIPPLESADIDDSTNWHMAEVLALSKMFVKTTLEYEKSNRNHL
ncbi:MAG: acylneuraminate cytidylyltransferase family protein [Opitutales bacterium]|nr:acylneuraminate cytidylyltransferase family protein [Opitutales bacterium]